MRVQLAQKVQDLLGQSDLVIITERIDDVALLIPTVCPSVASGNLLLYQSLPISIPYRYALWRRRQDDTGVGPASRGLVA